MIPRIQLEHGIPTLYVKGEPFFALAGELHNSSSSSLSYMKEHVWPNLKGLNMNTVLLALAWESVEPEDGQFDFTLLDGLIAQAREQNMHLAFLWFGLWKNAESMYVPGWMKTDSVTYFRARKVDGEKINSISPLCQAAVDRDARAFAQVMAHIRETDETESTVIFMQVENEIGLLGTPRDYSEEANRFFDEPIPEQLAAEYGADSTLTWKEAFGDNAEEYFMAYHFARAIEQITQAGQKEYPLPCYTNAWLKQYPWYPGSYPSGGPVVGVHRVWKLTAPSLFALAPDIYVPYAAQTIDEYSYEGNPLVIPEIRKDATTASYCLYAFCRHNAICYSPFGIEDLALDPASFDLPPAEVLLSLNIDPTAMDVTGSKEYLAAAYGLIAQAKPLLLKHRNTPHLQSYLKHSDTDFGALLSFKNYNLQVAYAPKAPSKPISAGIVLELSENEFLLTGMMSTFTFLPKPGENVRVEVLQLEEGTLSHGEWQKGRILNGDEKMSLRLGDAISCLKIILYKY